MIYFYPQQHQHHCACHLHKYMQVDINRKMFCFFFLISLFFHKFIQRFTFLFIPPAIIHAERGWEWNVQSDSKRNLIKRRRHCHHHSCDPVDLEFRLIVVPRNNGLCYSYFTKCASFLTGVVGLIFYAKSCFQSTSDWLKNHFTV